MTYLHIYIPELDGTDNVNLMLVLFILEVCKEDNLPGAVETELRDEYL